MQVRAGDIVLVRNNTAIGALIRFFTRAPWEPPSKVNHVGIITRQGDAHDAWQTNLIEAITPRCCEGNLDARYCGRKSKVAIYRATNISEFCRLRIVNAARSYAGDGYGYGKLITSALDWCLFGANVFRRLNRADKKPICSWIVSHAYSSVGLNFGVEPCAATPDDIWDFVKAHPDKYECIMPLGYL